MEAVLFRKGQLGASGAVTWDSTRLGSLEAMGPAGVDPETAAIEAGAQVESFLAALDEDEDDVQSVFMGL